VRYGSKNFVNQITTNTQNNQRNVVEKKRKNKKREQERKENKKSVTASFWFQSRAETTWIMKNTILHVLAYITATAEFKKEQWLAT
jgi:uncharacterized membrane protein YkvA (DUF1232 family)